ncbi:MAG: C39 family peptidase [Actinobacteria bacterium]|nr:C39 family peptidase [Actinomycetota bacterium]MBU4302400.1 C39 family peptidase [Actinomycetota bacterium]MBU4489940.1 C39 family peptidase [Actinomycetota bacterium]MCG2794372.1 C39 family peptidase [Actinomycetes bacterium]
MTNYFCGSASLEMVFDYFGPDIDQYEIAGVANSDPSYGCYTGELLRAAQFSSLSTSIQDPGLRGYTNRGMGYMAANAWWSDPPLVADRYNDLKELVSSDYPVLILTHYDASHTSGHYRVVKGYSDTLDVFIVHDPWYTLPYMGPNVNFNQAFLVDDLWTYSDRWGMVTAPWRVQVTKPGSVSSGQKFEVKAAVTYPGPSPLADQFACGSPYAGIELSNDYELLDASEAKNLAGITYTGTKGSVSWNVKAKKDKSNTNDIGVSAQGKITGSLVSYQNYEDLIGFGTRFSTYSPT